MVKTMAALRAAYMRARSQYICSYTVCLYTSIHILKQHNRQSRSSRFSDQSRTQKKPRAQLTKNVDPRNSFQELLYSSSYRAYTYYSGKWDTAGKCVVFQFGAEVNCSLIRWVSLKNMSIPIKPAAAASMIHTSVCPYINQAAKG